MIFTTFFSYSTNKTELLCANSRYSQCLNCFSYLLPAVLSFLSWLIFQLFQCISTFLSVSHCLCRLLSFFYLCLFLLRITSFSSLWKPRSCLPDLKWIHLQSHVLKCLTQDECWRENIYRWIYDQEMKWKEIKSGWKKSLSLILVFFSDVNVLYKEIARLCFLFRDELNLGVSLLMAMTLTQIWTGHDASSSYDRHTSDF